MGRGRAKAKQTKVARELKYGGPETDFNRLQAELATQGTSSAQVSHHDDDDDDADDPSAKYLDDAEDDDVDERRHA